MRLLVSADTHLGSPIRSVALRNADLGARLRQASRDAFARLVDLAISEQVDALVLAGDIFDSGHPDLRARAFVLAQLARAAGAGVPSVLIRGNHDALLDDRAHGPLGDGIHLLHRGAPTVRIGGAAFHGLSFEAAHSAESLLPGYPAPVPGMPNIGLMHTSLGGAAGHDPYAPCSEADLMAHGYDLWCLGHIHAPFERRDGPVLAVMPGIPQPRHFGERRGGTAALVQLGSGAPRAERRPIGLLGFAECTLDLTGCTDQQDVLAALRGALSGAAVPGRDIALRLRAATARLGTEEVKALAEEVLAEVDGMFLDKVAAAPPPQPPGAETDDLLRLMRREMAEEGLRHAARDQIEELARALPAEIRGALEEADLDALFEDALAEVAQALHGTSGAPR